MCNLASWGLRDINAVINACNHIAMWRRHAAKHWVNQAVMRTLPLLSPGSAGCREQWPLYIGVCMQLAPVQGQACAGL